MIKAVGLIEAELSAVTGVDYMECAQAYIAELELLDAELQATLESIPNKERQLVTNHSSLGYFAERYGFTVLETVIPGGTTLAEPSSADVVDLIEMINEEGIPTIFVDVAVSSEVAQLVATEASGTVGIVPLFSGSLGKPGSEADSYVTLMRTNVARIVGSLRAGP